MSTANDKLPVAVGDVLAGKYRVERVLGIGGMGIVVAAKHVTLEQMVALKFLLPTSIESTEAVERFLREAKAAVRLKSEHVAKVTDVGTLENGAPYMVMEYLAGADLAEVVRVGGRLSIEESVSFLLQAAEAIAEAHSLGIVHRDLKPQNLFVTRRVDGNPLIKVLDFGISKTVDAGGLSLTRTSSIMGSPLYMSPEQMRSTKTVDRRADIWALGVILYELLTGRVPFEAEAIPELCLKVVQDEPDPPNKLRPEIPEVLSAAVLRCLEKHPDDRFQNIAELASVLEPYAGERGRGATDRIASTLNVTSQPPLAMVQTGGRLNLKGTTGGSAWGGTQPIVGVPRARSRTPRIVAGGGAAAVVLGVVLFFALRSNNDKPVAAIAPVVASVVVTSTPAATTAVTPSVVPSAVVSAPLASATNNVPVRGGVGKPPGSATPGVKKDAAVAPAVTAPPRTFE